jgi:hypothetical protein
VTKVALPLACQVAAATAGSWTCPAVRVTADTVWVSAEAPVEPAKPARAYCGRVTATLSRAVPSTETARVPAE